MRYQFVLTGSVVIEADTLDEAMGRFADSDIGDIVVVEEIENLDNPDEDCHVGWLNG